MRLFVTALIALGALAACHQPLSACGYDFHGGCSTNIAFRINGTVDSFYVDNCPFGLTFQNTFLGDLQTLTLHKVTASTWESCTNNVTAVVLHYRVYEAGTAGGPWQLLSLQQDSVTVEGPYTTRHRGAAPQLSLTAGLVAGKNYVFEVFFEADVDTIGDDFIPETVLWQHNNGANYHLNFHYGGAAAPPFTVVPNRVRPVHCPGGADGVAGVSVYGNQNGLFYNWSGFSNNFYALYDVPAGAYLVAVSGAGGYTEIDTVLVPGPPPFTTAFTGVQPAGCQVSGQATIAISGGTAPYTYSWSNGQTGATAISAVSGSFTVTVTDARGCTAVRSVTVPAQTAVTVPLTAEICAGQTYAFGTQQLTQAGTYSATLSTPGGCDTTLQLTLAVLDPATLFATLPDSVWLTCLQPTLSICLPQPAGVSYQWWRNNDLLGAGPCCPATGAGPLTVLATLVGNLSICTASAPFFIGADADLPALTLEPVTVLNPFPCLSTTIDSVWITFGASTTTPGAQLSWQYGGALACIGGACSVFYPAFEPGVSELPIVTTSAPNGCQATASAWPVEVYANPLFTVAASITAASGADAADGAIALSTDGAVGTVFYSWGDGDTGAMRTGLLPGLHCVTVVDGTGCPRDTCLEVPFTVATTEPGGGGIKAGPNPVVAGSLLRVERTGSTFSGAAVLLVLDGQGRLVERLEWPAGVSALEWRVPAGMPSGPFFLQVLAAHPTPGRLALKLQAIR